MQIVGPGDVGQDAEIRTCNHADAELNQTLQEFHPVLEFPPPLDVSILFDAAEHDLRVCGNTKTLR